MPVSDTHPPSAAAAPAAAAAAPPKPWWRSRTIWFNGICTGLAAAELSLGLLQALLPVNAYALLSFVLVVGNTVLRGLTSAPLAMRQPGGADVR